MTLRTFSFSKTLVAAVAGLLLAVSQVQAHPPGGSARPGGGHPGGHGFRGGCGASRGYGWSGYPYYGYGYSGYESAYAAREQQYQTALLLQTLQYRAALLQMQAALRDQATQPGAQPAQGAQQQPPVQAKPQVPVKAISKPRPAERNVVLSDENRASAKLKMAKVFAEDGQVADAADYFREIVEKYPRTSAAREAQKSLDRVVRNNG